MDTTTVGTLVAAWWTGCRVGWRVGGDGGAAPAVEEEEEEEEEGGGVASVSESTRGVGWGDGKVVGASVVSSAPPMKSTAVGGLVALAQAEGVLKVVAYAAWNSAPRATRSAPTYTE